MKSTYGRVNSSWRSHPRTVVQDGLSCTKWPLNEKVQIRSRERCRPLSPAARRQSQAACSPSGYRHEPRLAQGCDTHRRMSSGDGSAGPLTRESPFTGRTAWVRNLETPLRRFLRTETGSAAVLLVAAVAALVWANVDAASYGRVWQTTFSIRIGHTSVSHDLRYWLNSGLMTLFFFVVGLEARREFDLGELRERRRLALPVAAGLGGMLVPVGLFLTLNAGRSSAHGWGVAMSTDTAFALGMLALVGRRFPFRLRAFMLTAVIVDDIVALAVIAL